jgi:hypothetical protein
MEMDKLMYLPLVIPLLVIALFVWFFMRKDRRHPLENNLTPAFKTTCGGIIGWMTYRGPFIRVAVYDNFLVVSCGKPYLLKFPEITELEPCTFAFAKGFRIKHANSDYPKRLEIWVKDRDGFLAALSGKVKVIAP